MKLNLNLFITITSVVIFLGTSSYSDASENSLIVNSWGGWFQEQQRTTMFRPFEKETGIKVIDLSDGESQLAKAKVQVLYGRGNMDIIHGDASWLFRGQKENLWAKLDYNLINTKEIYKDVVENFGFGILYWSFNIVYNKSVFPKNNPKTWMEVWEYAIDHPGRVAMWSARPNYMIEAALMAAGYEIDDVYPLDKQKVAKAFDTLNKIKSVVKWYDTGAQGQKLFYDQEVVLGFFYGGDAFGLIDKGLQLGVEWNQGIYTRDYWLILKNAPHMENAFRFIDFVSRAKIQAKFSESTSYGPVNKTAFQYISNRNIIERFPSFPPNKNRQLSYDYKWWGENDQDMIQMWNNWLRK